MLKVLDPIRIKDSMLLHSSIPEDDCPEWVPGATYAAQASAAGQLSDYVNLAGANPFNGLTEWYSSNGVPVVVNAAGNGGHGELRTTARDTLAGTNGWSPGSGSFVVYPGELLRSLGKVGAWISTLECPSSTDAAATFTSADAGPGQLSPV